MICLNIPVLNLVEKDKLQEYLFQEKVLGDNTYLEAEKLNRGMITRRYSYFPLPEAFRSLSRKSRGIG